MHNNIITSLKIVVYVILLFPLIYSEPLMALEIPGSNFIDEAILVLIILIILIITTIYGLNYSADATFPRYFYFLKPIENSNF